MATVNYGDVNTLFSLPDDVQTINKNIFDCIDTANRLYDELDNRTMDCDEFQCFLKEVDAARVKLEDDYLLLQGIIEWLVSTNEALKSAMGYANNIDNNGNGYTSNNNNGGGTVNPNGSNPTGSDPTGSDPTGSDPTCSDPKG